jgi:hypothetical protein
MPRKITSIGTNAITGTCQIARKNGASAASAKPRQRDRAPNASPASAPIANPSASRVMLSPTCRCSSPVAASDQSVRADFARRHQHLRREQAAEARSCQSESSSDRGEQRGEAELPPRPGAAKRAKRGAGHQDAPCGRRPDAACAACGRRGAPEILQLQVAQRLRDEASVDQFAPTSTLLRTSPRSKA